MLFVDYMLKETIQSPHTSFSLPLSNKEYIVVVCAVIFYFSPRVLFKFVIVLCCSVLTSPNMDEDWDLYAVVRSCKTPATTTTTTRTTSAAGPSNPANINMTNREADDSDGYFPNFDSLTFGNNENSFFIDQTLDNRNINNNPLHGDFSLMSNPSPPSTTSVSPTIGFQHQPSQFYPSTISFPVVNPQPIRPRRRKNQQNKMVRQMTQDQLSTDSWAWRKYGQKPIKGSPYPRNYYRCSTSKGCAARKQVERSPMDPNIYIVSYTGEHTHARPTHRSSLAGSTRTKFSPSTNIVAAATTTTTSNNIASDAIKTSCSSSSPAASGSSFSPSANTPLMDGDNNDEDNDDDDDDGVFFPNLVMDEDIFKGFGDINHGYCDDDEGGVSSSLFNSPPWTPPSSSGSNIRFSGGGHD